MVDFKASLQYLRDADADESDMLLTMICHRFLAAEKESINLIAQTECATPYSPQSLATRGPFVPAGLKACCRHRGSRRPPIGLEKARSHLSLSRNLAWLNVCSCRYDATPGLVRAHSIRSCAVIGISRYIMSYFYSSWERKREGGRVRSYGDCDKMREK